jgi:hypothetical protein
LGYLLGWCGINHKSLTFKKNKMKKVFALIAIVGLASCNNATDAVKAGVDTAKAAVEAAADTAKAKVEAAADTAKAKVTAAADTAKAKVEAATKH